MSQSPPRLARWTITALFVLMAVGVPALARLALAGTLGRARWPAVLGLILYEASVIGLALLAFPDYKRRYRQYVRREYGTLGFRAVTPRGALKVDLERLYVPQNLDVRLVNQPPQNILRMAPDQLRQGDHSIWDFLSSRNLAGQSLMVVGGPGSGKTTLLQHVAVSLAAKKPEAPAACRELLPVLLFLGEHSGAIRANPYLPLTHLTADHLGRRQAPAPPPGWFERQLEEGNCLILLDGLNEIADPQLRQVVGDWVKGCRLAHPRNRFIFTSRIREHRASPIPDALALELRPFGQKQAERLARQWRTARIRGRGAATGPEMPAAPGGNPLLLSLLLNLRQMRQALPARQVEIYAALLALAPDSGKLPAAHRQRLLQRLAYFMLRNRQIEIAPAEAANGIAPLLLALAIKEPIETVLSKLACATGVLVKSGAGRYRFAHLTFQEYLAAAHMAENQLQAELAARADDIWWHETIRLYCAQSEASAMAAGILNSDKVSAAGLALECLDEVRGARPAIWAYCQTVLRDVLDSEEAERRKWVAEALLASRLRRLASQNNDRADRADEGNDWARDSSLITCAEYQLFLDERRVEGQFYQPDHWPGYRYPAGQGLRPLTGVRAADAAVFCEWLSERQPGEWTYRLPTAHEVRDTAHLAETTRGLGYWTASPAGERNGREYVVFELAWADTSRPPLLSETVVMEHVQADLTRDLLQLTPGDLPRDLECNRLLAEALALSRELDHDLGSAQDPTHDLEGAQALAHDLAGALGYDLGLDMGFDFELARDRERALGYDFSLAREPDLGPDAESMQALANVREKVGPEAGVCWLPRLSALDLTPAQALAGALGAKLERLSEAGTTLTEQLEKVLEHNLSLALDRDLDRDLALALDSDRALASALKLKLHRAYNLKLARALKCAGELSERPEHAADRKALDDIVRLTQEPDAGDDRTLQRVVQARDLAIAVDLNLTVALELARVHLRDRDRASQLACLLAAARDLARDRDRRRNRGLARLVFLLNALLTRPAAQPEGEAAPEAADIERQQLSTRYLELYQDFVMLESRVAGNLPPFEGICLVRARV